MPITTILGVVDVNGAVATITIATAQNVHVATMIYPLIAIVLFYK
jgi:hypothetical protein